MNPPMAVEIAAEIVDRHGLETFPRQPELFVTSVRRNRFGPSGFVAIARASSGSNPFS